MKQPCGGEGHATPPIQPVALDPSLVLLADLDVLVVDCQTTGASPHHGDVLEIGWTTVRAAGPVEPVHAHRVALPEGREIPRVVSRLTGLVRESLEDALAPAAAWRLLCAAASEIAGVPGEPAPTVIHFARFELAFLHDLHRRFDPGASFPLDVVCAHEIANRILPDLPRRGLRALAGYFGHGVDLQRRSGGHVEATGFVWRRLLSELDARGVRTFSELKVWLDVPSPAGGGRRVFPLPRERRLSLPDAPGVYRFLRTNGDVLYVGKATSLRKRVSSHFTCGRHTERALEMLTQAREVATTVTASALEAALLESDEIKAVDPPYNVQLRDRERGVWFASPDLRDASPRPEARGSIGPVPSRHSLSPLAAIRALASGEAATSALRARALGVPLDFAPDEASCKSSLANASLRLADLSHARLDESSLAGARLTGATLHRTSQKGADLTGADLRQSRGTDAEHARAEDFSART